MAAPTVVGNPVLDLVNKNLTIVWSEAVTDVGIADQILAVLEDGATLYGGVALNSGNGTTTTVYDVDLEFFSGSDVPSSVTLPTGLVRNVLLQGNAAVNDHAITITGRPTLVSAAMNLSTSILTLVWNVGVEFNNNGSIQVTGPAGEHFVVPSVNDQPSPETIKLDMVTGASSSAPSTVSIGQFEFLRNGTAIENLAVTDFTVTFSGSSGPTATQVAAGSYGARRGFFDGD